MTNTVKVLSLDGGGERGIISLTWMNLFMDLWGKDPNKIYNEFDIICGSSIGGIIAMGFAMGLSPTDMMPFFTTDGPWIFTTDPSNPSVRPSTLSKVNTIVGGPLSNPTFYPSDVSGIGTMRLKSKLVSVFGSTTLQQLKTDVVITSFEKNDDNHDFSQFTNTPVYFSSVASTVVPNLAGQTALCSDIAMATSAAPLYFPAYSFTLPGDSSPSNYIDGGVVDNNPSNWGLAVGRALKPGASRYCVLSVGTGLGEVGFPPSLLRAELALFRTNPELFASIHRTSSAEMSRLTALDNLGALEGAYLILYLLDAQTAGPQEINAKELDTLCKYVASNLFNYRMQYYLDPTKDTTLDNTSSDIISYYQTSATTVFNNDTANIVNFQAHLDA